jgi:acyl-CoA synthetase (AMP-forming)/AMP-acid ligase II
MNLCALLIAQALKRPATQAIIQPVEDGEKSISFGDLDARSAQAAARLRRAGVGRGDRVLLLVPMSIDLYVAIVGALRIGAVVVLLDPSAGVSHVDRCCQMAKPSAVIAVSKAQVLRLFSAGLRAIPKKFTLDVRWLPGESWNGLERLQPDHDLADVSPEDPALLTFTSGSTGQPKGAVRSHGLLLAQQEALGKALGLNAGSRDLTTLPVFVLCNLAAGVTSIITDADLRSPGAIDAGPILAQVDRHGPSSVVASPALLARLASVCNASGRSMPSLGRVFTGGAPVFWHVLDALAKAAPNARVYTLYGSTEAEPIAEIALDQLTAEDRLATERGGGLPGGIPVPEVQLRIIADRWGVPIKPISATDLGQMTMKTGEIGEIVVTGQHVLKGYLNGQGDEETKFRVDGQVWHRTGDSGYLDEQGRLWLTGRCVGKVVDERGCIYPLQVEGAVHAIFDLHRAAFVACNSRRLLVIEPGSRFKQESRPEIVARLDWARVDEVVTVDQIPVDKRHNAKVDYPALVRLIQRL